MTKEREYVELTIGWDTSFYNEQTMQLASKLDIDRMICFLTNMYRTVTTQLDLYTDAWINRKVPGSCINYSRY